MKVKQLTVNMRAVLSGDVNQAQFCDTLLALGEGRTTSIQNTDTIVIPENLGQIVYTVQELQEKIYPNLPTNYVDMEWLSERTILSPHNASVNSMNEELLQKLPGETHICRSIDTALTPDESLLYPTEFLNSLNPPGLPQHKLQLKIGCPVILLRNLNPPLATNGTRCILTRISRCILEVQVAVGHYKGEKMLIPRIPLMPTSSDLPFNFKRLQFPVKLCLSMTINKAQGQTFKHVGIDLREDCFSHGQLYVAASRTGSPNNLTVLCRTLGSRTARNPVYKEIFSN
jgi:ATP-dependent DNA helicase PIF1